MTKPPRERNVTATVTFLEMTGKPAGGPPPPRPMMKVAILRAEQPPIHFYKYLYSEIGRDYCWVERLMRSDAELTEMLHNPRVHLYVLYLGGVPAGIAECDFRKDGYGYIAYFGLIPEFVGRRIAPWFLNQTIEMCWSQPINKLLVNTCTLDHPRALPLSQRAGFSAYGREERLIPIPTDFVLPEPRPGSGPQ